MIEVPIKYSKEGFFIEIEDQRYDFDLGCLINKGLSGDPRYFSLPNGQTFEIVSIYHEPITSYMIVKEVEIEDGQVKTN